MRALDFFAADGSRLSSRVLEGYAVEAWDIRADYLEKYAIPDATKRCGDSFKLATETTPRSYDAILIDAPAGCFSGHCEHFEALEAALPLLRDEGTIIFNVFTSPLLYLAWQPLHGGSTRNSLRRYVGGDLAQWNQARRRYYRRDNLLLHEYLDHYSALFQSKGYETLRRWTERRGWGIYLSTWRLRRIIS